MKYFIIVLLYGVVAGLGLDLNLASLSVSGFTGVILFGFRWLLEIADGDWEDEEDDESNEMNLLNFQRKYYSYTEKKAFLWKEIREDALCAFNSETQFSVEEFLEEKLAPLDKSTLFQFITKNVRDNSFLSDKKLYYLTYWDGKEGTVIEPVEYCKEDE